MNMASKLSLFLLLNLLIFALVSVHGSDDKCSKGCPPPTPKEPLPPSPIAGKCPIDALKLGVCADLLKHLVKIKLGEPPVKPCCSLIKDLVDVEAALCLCTAIKQSSVLGIKLDVPLSLSLLLNVCGKKAPSGFQCPE